MGRAAGQAFRARRVVSSELTGICRKKQCAVFAEIPAPLRRRLFVLVILSPFCSAPIPPRRFCQEFPLVEGILGSASPARRLYFACSLQAPPAAQHKSMASFGAKARAPAQWPPGWFAAPLPDPTTWSLPWYRSEEHTSE